MTRCWYWPELHPYLFIHDVPFEHSHFIQRAAMSFRKINNAGRRINIGTIPSFKMKRNVWTESLLERDLGYQLEYDSDVISYREQALRIFYELDGKRRYYTPDFLCERKNRRPQIIEVKYKKQLSPWFEQLFRIITPICDREGFEFLVYTESEIRIQPLLDNIKLQRRYARTPLYPYHQLLCEEFFSSRVQATLEEVFEFFSKRKVEKQVVLALLYHGFLSTDLTILLGINSPVRYDTLRQTGEVA